MATKQQVIEFNKCATSLDQPTLMMLDLDEATAAVSVIITDNGDVQVQIVGGGSYRAWIEEAALAVVQGGQCECGFVLSEIANIVLHRRGMGEHTAWVRIAQAAKKCGWDIESDGEE